MSDAGNSPRSPHKSASPKPSRSQTSTTKVPPGQPPQPQDTGCRELDDNSANAPTKSVVVQGNPLSRSHTPGHLASKSINDRRQRPSDLPIRKRSQSASHSASKSGPGTCVAFLPPISNNGDPPSDNEGLDQKQSSASRTNAFVADRKTPSSSATTRRTPKLTKPPEGEHIPFPPFPDAASAPDVEPAPPSGMYWSKAFVSGSPHSNLRAHTTTLIGSNVYIFGGCDAKTCFNTLYVLDADAFYWSAPLVVGEFPLPLRAMTCTAVGRKLVVFGGGDGPDYYNDVYVLDTMNFRWTKPRIVGDKVPSKRRAHTACLYKMGIYVFGGGDGVRALNDIWRLDVSDSTKMSWRLISAPVKASSSSDKKETCPKARGYHTANMVGSKLIIFGGSDGGECFDDVWIYDIDKHLWKAVNMSVTYRRLSHTATIVGSYLFVLGGHDGSDYCNDVLLLNLVTMTWDKRRVYGKPPSERGYHGTVLYDSRLIVIGGFDGTEVYGDVTILELAVHAYYSQISHFTIDV
ncbi:hypothetical protein E4U43_005166 [Claviceps pusilla]|uniref:KEL2-involved in cell fusion and morphogenesis n=1 Tax=Claviceps pusilla TaxID=123648 RepID=A0A9P7N4X2_9HYPO|nr:hypothetical protein E4U43_005166 [Claviceps pusilla]